VFETRIIVNKIAALSLPKIPFETRIAKTIKPTTIYGPLSTTYRFIELRNLEHGSK
jgi:hypothetical protein